MEIQEAVEICVTRKYADFTGVATRSEFWWFMGFVFGIELLVDQVLESMAGVFGLVMLVPSLAAAVRRLHDTGRSGWWLLLLPMPVVGQVVLVIFLAQERRTATTPTT